MAGIDWTYVGAAGGEAIEDFVAACLRQRYTDARQTKAASGDGGIDVVRETAGGLVVWQVKKFTAPLTAQQRRQVQKSWNRFHGKYVEAGVPVVSYHLATPWTPTDEALEWFRSEVCGETGFPVMWEGAAFFNGMAAEFAATFDRFFKGPDVLDNMVLAKAVLASSPVEQGDQSTMLEALSTREATLRELRDLVSDNYYVDTGTRSGTGDTPPLPSTGESGVFYRYTRLDNSRWYVESVVPKNAQSPAVEPIAVELEFIVDANSDEEQSVKDWYTWGIPFENVLASTRSRGGPLQDPAPRRGLVSFRPAPNDASYPDLVLTSAHATPERSDQELVFTADEVSRGVVGGGLRVRAVSRARLVQLDLRNGSDLAPDSADIRLLPTDGLTPELVCQELGALLEFAGDRPFGIFTRSGPRIILGRQLEPPPYADFVRQIACDLAALQPHASGKFVMPDLEEVTEAQAEHLHSLAQIYAGNAIQQTWDKIVLTIKDPDGLRELPLDGSGVLAQTVRPTFAVGTREFQMGRRLAWQYVSPTLAAGVDRSRWQEGDEVELVAGHDDRLVIAAIVDDEW